MKYGFSLLALALSGLTSGCGDGGFDCEVVWWEGKPDVSQRLGTASLSYPEADDTKEAVAQCQTEQADLPDRPAEAQGYSCLCSSK